MVLFMTPTSGGSRCKLTGHGMLSLLRTKSTSAVTAPTFRLSTSMFFKCVPWYMRVFCLFVLFVCSINRCTAVKRGQKEVLQQDLLGTTGVQSNVWSKSLARSTFYKRPAELSAPPQPISCWPGDFITCPQPLPAPAEENIKTLYGLHPWKMHFNNWPNCVWSSWSKKETFCPLSSYLLYQFIHTESMHNR